MQKATVPTSHMGSVWNGTPKLSRGSAEVVGHTMDTVHLLPKKGELTTSSVSGATGCFVREKYPPNTECCWDRKNNQQPMTAKYSKFSLPSFLAKRGKTPNQSHGRKLCIHQRPGISKGAEDGVFAKQVPIPAASTSRMLLEVPLGQTPMFTLLFFHVQWR